MKGQYQASAKYLVLASIALLVAAAAFTSHQPTVFLNEQGQVVGTYDLTVLFRIVSGSALVIGLLVLATAIRRLLAKESSRTQPDSSLLRFGQRYLRNGHVWTVFNAALVLLCIWTGYGEMLSDAVQRTSGIIVCLSILVFTPLFVIGSLVFATVERLRTPAFDRFSLNWGGDPLQAVFIMTLCTLAALVGSLIRLSTSGSAAVWTVAAYCSLLSGLLIGQAIVYRIFRNQISKGSWNEITKIRPTP